MAYDETTVQTMLAYRLGETSSPGDSTTLAQRRQWINDAYMDLASRRNWWWLEASDSSNTNTASTTGYPEPSDLKEFIELKVGSIYYDQIPYRQNRDNATTLVTLPSLITQKQYYRFGGRYYFVVTDAGDATAHDIKYYKRVTPVVAGGTFLIPDEYIDMLAAFAEARYWLSIFQQTKAVAPMQQYEDKLKLMAIEQGRRGYSHKQMTDVRDPEDAYY